MTTHEMHAEVKEGKIIKEWYRCTFCSNRERIIRRSRWTVKEIGHIKTMYCFDCRGKTSFEKIQ